MDFDTVINTCFIRIDDKGFSVRLSDQKKYKRLKVRPESLGEFIVALKLKSFNVVIVRNNNIKSVHFADGKFFNPILFAIP